MRLISARIVAATVVGSTRSIADGGSRRGEKTRKIERTASFGGEERTSRNFLKPEILEDRKIGNRKRRVLRRAPNGGVGWRK